MMGPGRYDDECTMAREATKAHTIFLIVFGGEKGDGFSAQTADPVFMDSTPALLRFIADQLDLDMAKPEGTA